MQATEFQTLVKEFLFPLYPGTVFFGGRQNEPNSDKLVAQHNNKNYLKLKPRRYCGYSFIVTRSQPFSDNDQRTIRILLDVLADPDVEKIVKWDGPLPMAMLSNLMARVVSKSLDEEKEKLIGGILEIFQSWAEQTYEGQHIAATVCIDPQAPSGKVKLIDAYKEDFSKVLSNGSDTIIICHSNGTISSYLPMTYDNDFDIIAPLRFIPLAKYCTGERIGISLNRNGEILLFKNQQLVYAKRRGSWRYFDHEIIIRQMAAKQTNAWSYKLRKAVYLSALDVSFGRCGGCIGYARKKAIVHGQGKPVQTPDVMKNGASIKSQTLRQLLGGKTNFGQLSRSFRQELLGIDGATVLAHNGDVIAAGAILAVAGGSQGGGRSLAAKTLGIHGVGIKISNDGCIQAYKGTPAPDQKPLFEIG